MGRAFTLALVVSALALASCGGQDQGSASRDAAEAGQAAAGGSLNDVAATQPDEEALGAALQSCLDLVREMRFAEAIPVCTEAVKQNPENAEAKNALDRAQQQAAAGEVEESAGEMLDLGERSAAEVAGEAAPGETMPEGAQE